MSLRSSSCTWVTTESPGPGSAEALPRRRDVNRRPVLCPHVASPLHLYFWMHHQVPTERRGGARGERREEARAGGEGVHGTE